MLDLYGGVHCVGGAFHCVGLDPSRGQSSFGVGSVEVVRPSLRTGRVRVVSIGRVCSEHQCGVDERTLRGLARSFRSRTGSLRKEAGRRSRSTRVLRSTVEEDSI